MDKRPGSRTFGGQSGTVHSTGGVVMSNPMMQAMQQLQMMQQKMAEAQAALEHKTVTETGGGGLVRVTVNGHRRILKLELSPEAMTGEDKEMVEDLLISTINKAMESAAEMANNDIGDATRGLMPDIPGLDLPI
jgi:DNA-binding YbaB/EbfC family protein